MSRYPAGVIRYNEDGTVDEVYVDGGVHMEQMGEEAYWIGFYPAPADLNYRKGDRTCVWLRAKLLPPWRWWKHDGFGWRFEPVAIEAKRTELHPQMAQERK